MAVSLDSLNFTLPSVPPHAGQDMPEQDLAAATRTRFARPSLSTTLARLTTFGGAAALTAYAAYQMVVVVSLAEITSLQWLMVGIFVLTFAWIALAATGAVAGVLFGPRRLAGTPGAKLDGSTVLLMPVYNEDPARTFAGLAAMGAALADRGAARNFEIFVISDTTDPDVWVRETAAFHSLRELLDGKMHVWYRRRHENRARKSGNVQDFVTQWGARYDYMVVLDADSLLSAETLIDLVREMDADPGCGLLQSLPRLCGGATLFGRLQQFAASVYGPIVASGIAAWQGDDGNYWGHNAIIRIEAFAAAAGLPVLPGRKPFGGEILSHDFVEAALMRRAGWSVRMLPALPGSWEESPPSLLDVAARDRRWAQGNLQHLSVVTARGLRWPNRVHMLIGVMSYLASPLWLAFIGIGLAITAQVATVRFEYFSEELSLFPRWPVFDSERMIALFVLTMAVLLLPKVLGILKALGDARLRRRLGPARLVVGAGVETVFSVLYAPISMLIQTRHIADILRGKDSGWARQQREARDVPWSFALRAHWGHTVFGLALAAALVYLSVPLLMWMLPTIVGLALAVPLSRLSGSRRLAARLRRWRILSTLEEVAPPAVFAERDRAIAVIDARLRECAFEGLLKDDGLRERHCSAAVAMPPADPARPDTVRLSARAKIAMAGRADEAVAYLSKQERMAVMSHPELLTALVALGAAEQPSDA